MKKMCIMFSTLACLLFGQYTFGIGPGVMQDGQNIPTYTGDTTFAGGGDWNQGGYNQDWQQQSMGYNQPMGQPMGQPVGQPMGGQPTGFGGNGFGGNGSGSQVVDAGNYSEGDSPCARPDEPCGDCYCLYRHYRPCYYYTCHCEYCPKYSYQKCCRYVPQFYTKKCCRYVPQYYEVPCCRYVPQYYCTCNCQYCPKYHYQKCCKYVPEYYYKRSACGAQGGCGPSGCGAQ